MVPLLIGSALVRAARNRVNTLPTGRSLRDLVFSDTLLLRNISIDFTFSCHRGA
jgi:hypothetical protein